MCGIYGSTIFYKESQVKEKLKRTAFRGPDQMGVKFYKSDAHSIALGHNRLSIIDLDARSNQPFAYQNKIEIVFNGEIYNFNNIKKHLIKKGYEFNTTSDTEVICAAYLEYGEKCVSHFNGMFAFVIFDKTKNIFFGARDRLGQKPFYYYHNKKEFEFASQISSIQLYNSNLSISKQAISAYLSWGSVPDPLSIFNEVKKLEPGKSFVFDLLTGDFSIKTYWDIDYLSKNKFSGTYDEAKNELNSLLSDAVKGRLFADVPVGVFLSGGVDSSVIAALATKTSSAKVKTFSVKFDNENYDESSYANLVAHHLNTNHNIIECNYDEGIDLIENFHHFYDEPFADSSAIPSMLLSKYTKEQVTVALSGDGGDESFLGYRRYNWAKNQSNIYRIPLAIRKIIASVFELNKNYKSNVIARGLRIKNINEAYVSVLNGIDQSWSKAGIITEIGDEMKYLLHKEKKLLERISDFDMKTYLNWDINTKVDRASMAYSLEVRSPLMDYRVVDFAHSLPTKFKVEGKNQKRILKDILYQYVPKEIFDRPKSGFGVPIAIWFKEDLKDYVLSELNDEGLRNIPGIDIDKVKFRIKQHMDGSWNRSPLIWKLLVLKQWLNHNASGREIK